MKKFKLAHFNLGWILVFILTIFALLVVIFRFSKQSVFLVLLLAACIYLTIATIHHIRDKTLKLEILLEYIFIAVLALIILQSIILI